MGENFHDFDRYREKVVDMEWLYEPSLEENLRKVWTETAHDSVRKAFNALDNNNLRVMQKVKSSLVFFEKFIQGSNYTLRDLVEERISLICIIYNAFPEYRFILDDHGKEKMQAAYMLAMGGDVKKGEPSDPKKEKIERALGWSHTETDTLIYEFLTNGFVSSESANALFEEGQRAAIASIADTAKIFIDLGEFSQ